MPRIRAVIAVGICVSLSACDWGDETHPDEPIPAPPPTEKPRSEFFGVNADVLFTFLLQGLGPLVDHHLAQIAAAPIGFVRSSLDWRRIEPTAPSGAHHDYDFSSHDAWVGGLAHHGLRWAPTMLGFPVPPWAGDPVAAASCGSRAPPANAGDYAAFAAGLAGRYGRGGSFWRENPELPRLPITDYEIWNEPNHGAFWCPEPDPARYAELVVLTSSALRDVDRSARVVLGGLAPFEESDFETAPPRMSVEEFLHAVVEEEPDLRNAVDAVAVHPYGSEPESVLASLATLRQSLDDAGLHGLPMVANETGWPRQGARGGFSVVADEATRASYLGELAEAVEGAADALGISSLAPYSWVTAEMNPVDQEQWFGLADPQTTAPYESGNAYRDAVERLSSPP